MENMKNSTNLRKIVFDTLQNFPVIEKLMGKDWFLFKLKRREGHPLINLLAKGTPDYSEIISCFEKLKKTSDNSKRLVTMLKIYCLQRHYFLLTHLERFLKILKSEPKIKRVLDHLKNDEQFWSGYSEAEIAALLKNKFGEIELEPPLPSGKSADVKFKINNRWVFAEVTTPKMGEEYSKYIKNLEKASANYEFIEVPNNIADTTPKRARTIISNEFNHFRNIVEGVPVVIFINTNNCELDNLDVEDALIGYPKFVLRTYKETREFTGSWERDSWTVFREDERVKHVGAIICYTRDFTISGQIIFNVNFFSISFTKDDIKSLSTMFETHREK